MHYIFALLFIFLSFPAFTQERNFTVKGTVKDKETDKGMPATTIFLEENPSKGVFSDEKGNFSLSLPQGKHTLIISSFGYQNDTIPIDLHQDLTISVPLQVKTEQMEAVVLKGTAPEKNVKRTEMGILELNVAQTKKLPVLFGEADLMKTIQLLPGIQTSGEGNTGLYVRGGGPDQNLILIDDVPVYNTGHLFGFFSVFNSDAISKVVLHKGNMPASYGGRLSSVVDFTVKEGDYQKYKVDGGIGLIVSRLTVEGPIKKDKASFMVSGRRTYIDIVSKPFMKKKGTGLPYFFYDLNGKVTWKINPKNKILASGYYGSDDLKLTFFDDRFSTHTYWGNVAAVIKWQHIFSEKIFQNISIIHNKFGFTSSARFDQYNSEVSSSIGDYTFKLDYDYTPFTKHKIKFGASYTWHTYTPRRTQAQTDTIAFNNNTPNNSKYAHDVAFYLLDNWDITKRLSFSIGLRYNFFLQVGPYNYIYDTGNSIDTTIYKKGALVKSWGGLEPRAGLRYMLNETSSVKTAFNVNNQYVHLVSLTGNSMPFDIWLPSSIRIKPQRGWQYALGYFRNLKDNHYEFSIEGYYKAMKNQLEYRQDYVPKISGEVEEDIVSGKGWSCGLEFFLKKRLGNLQGWIGYTLSKTWRKFPQINEGSIFPAHYDRRHDLNIVATYAINKRWDLGGTFVFATGQAITLPERRYIVGGVVYYQYGDRNSYRMQPYNRLDLAITYKNKETRKFKSSFTLSIYNVYNRKNPYIYFIDATGDPLQGELSLKAKKLYLFPILPSLTWNFSF